VYVEAQKQASDISLVISVYANAQCLFGFN